MKEDTEVDGEKKKQYYLKCPFLEAEVLNKNGRRNLLKDIIKKENNGDKKWLNC